MSHRGATPRYRNFIRARADFSGPVSDAVAKRRETPCYQASTRIVEKQRHVQELGAKANIGKVLKGRQAAPASGTSLYPACARSPSPTGTSPLAFSLSLLRLSFSCASAPRSIPPAAEPGPTPNYSIVRALYCPRYTFSTTASRFLCFPWRHMCRPSLLCAPDL